MTRLSYQIPNFTYPGRPTPAALRPAVVAPGQRAEAAGFDRVMVMDHFYQLPALGEPGEPMLECYTRSAAFAQPPTGCASRLWSPAIPTGTPRCSPRRDRARPRVGWPGAFGIGAGWFELEHDGWVSSSVVHATASRGSRRHSTSSCRCSAASDRRSRASTTGQGCCQLAAAALEDPRDDRRQRRAQALRLVAHYADESNLMGMRGDLDVPHKLAVLAEHCEREGRDRSEIAVTVLLGCVVAPTAVELDADLRSMAEAKGWGDGVIDMVKQLLIVGDPDTVGERLAEIAASGVHGLTFNLPVNGHVPGRIALLGEIADRALTAAGR